MLSHQRGRRLLSLAEVIQAHRTGDRDQADGPGCCGNGRSGNGAEPRRRRCSRRGRAALPRRRPGPARACPVPTGAPPRGPARSPPGPHRKTILYSPRRMCGCEGGPRSGSFSWNTKAAPGKDARGNSCSRVDVLRVLRREVT